MIERASLTFLAPIGRLRVTVAGDRLTEVKLRAPEMGSEATSTASPALAVASEARDQILRYLDGDLRQFTVPYRLGGSVFQQAVLRAMAQIPYGRTQPYGALARDAGDPGAARAVGAVCGANPVPLVVPCHRVVGAQDLGGFGGGLDMKRWLLTLEATGRPPAPLDADGCAIGSAETTGTDGSPNQLSLF